MVKSTWNIFHDPTRKENGFQVNNSTVHKALRRHQRGAVLHIPQKYLVGYTSASRLRAQIVGVKNGSTLPLRCKHIDHRGKSWDIDLSFATIMASGVTREWQKLKEDEIAMYFANLFLCEKNRISAQRAEFLARLLPYHTGDLVLTLDGSGENHKGFINGGWGGKDIVTLEIDASLALFQQSILGLDCRYTGGDSDFVRRCIEGGNRRSPGIEALILHSNSIISEEEKQRVKILYLDYCGGAIESGSSPQRSRRILSKMLNKLPNLRVFALTMSKRRHPGLKPETFFDCPEEFIHIETFTENTKVVCWVYVRRNVVSLKVPGFWWNNSTTREKKLNYDGVVTGYDPVKQRYAVRILHDNSNVAMTGAAVQKYRFKAVVDAD